jgi:hypothetical protein
MVNRQNKTQNNNGFDLYEYFRNPVSARQNQYEAVRAVIIEKQSPQIIAKKFGYKL